MYEQTLYKIITPVKLTQYQDLIKLKSGNMDITKNTTLLL